MEWGITISLIAVGIALLIIEMLFIPGTTLAGTVGFISLVSGVWVSFSYFGAQTGWIVTGITGVISSVLVYYSFTSNLWGRFALKRTIKSKVNEGELDELQMGMEGVTLSVLRPVGKAEFLGKAYEVSTRGGYISTGEKIKIKKIKSHQIIVEPTN